MYGLVIVSNAPLEEHLPRALFTQMNELKIN
ncbi:hypothetical protein BN1805_03064 [Proteus vulgaris]|nr:hypothetical protein BN1805_03064 [Proteus vulgaris]